MARDLTISVREAVVEAMSSATVLTDDLGVEDRVYGESPPDRPAWPFIRMDLPVVAPDFDGCGDASLYSFRIHAFAKGEDSRAAATLQSAIVEVLDGLNGNIVVNPEAVLKDTLWTGSRVFRDTEEVNGWHGTADFECRVSG